MCDSATRRDAIGKDKLFHNPRARIHDCGAKTWRGRANKLCNDRTSRGIIGEKCTGRIIIQIRAIIGRLKANFAIDNRLFSCGKSRSRDTMARDVQGPLTVGYFVYLRSVVQKAWPGSVAAVGCNGVAVIAEGQVKRESMTPFFLVSHSFFLDRSSRRRRRRR